MDKRRTNRNELSSGAPRFEALEERLLLAASIMGTPADDILIGADAADKIICHAGDDTADGAGGDDRLQGGMGDDILYGGAGDDRLKGNDGNDILIGGTGSDTVSGGAGHDTIRHVVADHLGTSDVDTYHGGDGIDELAVDLGGVPYPVAEGMVSAITEALDAGKGKIDCCPLGLDGFGVILQGIEQVNFVMPNRLPDAMDDAYTVAELSGMSVAAPGILGNDIDPDGGPLTVVEINGSASNMSTTLLLPSGATLLANPDGNFYYIAAGDTDHLAAGEEAIDRFTYTINDSQGDSDTATVTITIEGVNDAPVAINDSFATLEDTPLVMTPQDNDTDADASDVPTIGSFTQPANGSVVDNGDGTLTYTPNANFHGSDSFEYTLSDGQGGTDTATVNIDVTGVNEMPVAVDDTFETGQNITFFGDVTVNDVGLGDQPVTVTLVSSPAHGALSMFGDGTFMYDPDDTYAGLDEFEYMVQDADGEYSTATVTIEIAPVNSAPVDIALSSDVVVEEDPGAVIGALTTTDPDVGDTHVYMVLNDSRFEVAGDVLKLKATDSLDYETESSVDLMIRTVDSGGLFYSEWFTIVVTDVNETP
ncbi:MAG: Ig-like domain-containing protein [Planctomycetota bacterium]